MPAEQPICGDGLYVVGSCIQHHLDDALDIAVGRQQSAHFHTEVPSNRSSDLIRIQFLALDLARAHYILGEGAQLSFTSQVEPEVLQPAE